MAVKRPRDASPDREPTRNRADTRRAFRIWPRLHFLLRAAALAGVLALAVGLVLGGGAFALLNPGPEGGPEGLAGIGSWLSLVGAGVLGFGFLIEVVVGLGTTASSRSAAGVNSAIQVALAAGLLLAVNVYSVGLSLPIPEPVRGWFAGRALVELPGHHLRVDLTRGRLFTLPPDLRNNLARLDRQGETTVVIYLRDQAYTTLGGAPDHYDAAARAKVVEKVRDLAAQLREVGPQLRVEVLDVGVKGYPERLDALTLTRPGLREAIQRAPENTIFVVGGGHLQQMTFSEFFQLDKVASAAAGNGRGNLVLLGQGPDGRGVEPFVRRILNLEQRRPRVGVLVVHEALTTEGSEDIFTLAGLRKSLTAHGFDVRDVVLRKGWESRSPNLDPAADTFEESKLERLDAELETLDEDLKDLRAEIQAQQTALEDVRPRAGEDEAKNLEALTKRFGRLFVGGRVTAAGRVALEAALTRDIGLNKEELTTLERDRERVVADRERLDPERAAESRRLSDVKAKLSYTLADCDLLFVPRLTRRGNGQAIIPRLHRMSPEQVAAIKEFLKAGKPLLASVGPINEPPGAPASPVLGPAGPDDFERLLGELGFRLGKHTVLFPADAKAFAERRQDLLRQAAPVEVPDLDFTSPGSLGSPRLGTTADLDDNPLRRGLRVLARSTSPAAGGFELRMRFPRPVYHESLGGTTPEYDPTVLLTSSGWNDDQPFPTADRRPRFTPPPPDDPDAGSLEVKRRGAFPVGAALKVTLPEAWGAPKGQTARVAVLGQGDLFVGQKLSPTRERLLLQTTNWLLGRDDYLPHADSPWAFPRVALEPGTPEFRAWTWGTRLGLPLLFACLGFAVLLYRRLP